MKCYEGEAANWLTSQRRHWISGKQWGPKIRLQSPLQEAFKIDSLICAQIWLRMWSRSWIMKKMLTLKISQSIFILPHSKKNKNASSLVLPASESVNEFYSEWLVPSEWQVTKQLREWVREATRRIAEEVSGWASEWVRERAHCGTNQRAKQEWIIDDQQAVEMKLRCRPEEHHPAASHHLLRSQRAHPAVSPSCQHSSSSSCLK